MCRSCKVLCICFFFPVPRKNILKCLGINFSCTGYTYCHLLRDSASSSFKFVIINWTTICYYDIWCKYRNITSSFSSPVAISSVDMLLVAIVQIWFRCVSEFDVTSKVKPRNHYLFWTLQCRRCKRSNINISEICETAKWQLEVKVQFQMC